MKSSTGPSLSPVNEMMKSQPFDSHLCLARWPHLLKMSNHDANVTGLNERAATTEALKWSTSFSHLPVQNNTVAAKCSLNAFQNSTYTVILVRSWIKYNRRQMSSQMTQCCNCSWIRFGEYDTKCVKMCGEPAIKCSANYTGQKYCFTQ